MSYISGEEVKLMAHKTDEEIVEMCLQVLRKMFYNKVKIRRHYIRLLIFEMSKFICF